MGTYEITENKSDALKFRAMVSFNGKPAEYYEVDWMIEDPLQSEGTQESNVEYQLQATANDDAERTEKLAVVPELEIVDGKVN